MENVADALKIAGAVLIFMVAFSITMVMFSMARSTTDAVLDNLKIDEFMPKVEALGINETRRVGIETVIPTIYRYAQSDDNIQVRILDSSERELQVFDQEIEGLIQSRDINIPNLPQNADVYAYYQRLKSQYDDRSKPAYMFEAGWANQDSKLYILERINSYIYGVPAKHLPELENAYTSNNLMTHKDETFTETYLEYRTSGQVYTDEYGEEIVLTPARTKVIITYKLD